MSPIFTIRNKLISFNKLVTFTIEEMIKRSMLLMRHELLNSGCRLKVDYVKEKEILLQGDINNLIQVLDNQLSNAIFAQKQVGGGEIEIEITHDEMLRIFSRPMTKQQAIDALTQYIEEKSYGKRQEDIRIIIK